MTFKVCMLRVTMHGCRKGAEVSDYTVGIGGAAR